MRENAIEPTDERLMALHAQGDREAFRELFNRYARRVFSFLYSMSSDRETAMDLAQETFIRIHRARATYDAARPFRPWLFTIAANTWTDLSRSWFWKLKRRTERLFEVSGPGEGGNPAPLAARNEDYARLRAHLGRLSEHQRLAVQLHDLEGLSCREIARVTGRPVGTVLSWLRRGRRALRDRLEASGGKGAWL